MMLRVRWSGLCWDEPALPGAGFFGISTVTIRIAEGDTKDTSDASKNEERTREDVWE
jgi:hypothetical protein